MSTTEYVRYRLSSMASFLNGDYRPPSTAGIDVYEHGCIVDRESFIAEYINLENPV